MTSESGRTLADALPGLSELEARRLATLLSQANVAVDPLPVARGSAHPPSWRSVPIYEGVATRVFDSDLTPPARQVALTLVAMGVADIPTRVSLTELSAATGLSRSTVARKLRELEEGGYVFRKREVDPSFGHATTIIGFLA